MTQQEAIDYIESYTWSTTRLGLERTRELLRKLGDPQKELKFIHVAGSNGKGSTCAMLDAILRRAGYRAGLYTSPYIQDFCERMQVDGENIPGHTLADITERVRLAADAMEDHPSQFELVTAIAMEYFREQRCDIVVLEVGMGGSLDSTNVIDAPEVAVITNIGLEHTEYLGDTLEKIAATKAGIIKPGCSCVCYDGAPEVISVIRSVCEQNSVPLTCAGNAPAKAVSQDLNGQVFSWRGAEYRLSLLGSHQIGNASVVLETVEALRGRGWNIPKEAVRDGLREVKWPARLEILNRKPLFILDGGHNPQCAEALVSSISQLLPGKRVVFLTGVLADKDYPQIMELMMPCAQEFVCLTPVSDRALSADALADCLTKHGAKASACTDIPDGIRMALTAAGEDGAVIAFGSLYLAGAVRTAFAPALRQWLRKEKIQARDSLSPEARVEKSGQIVQRIIHSREFQNSKTVMLYRAARAEVSLNGLEKSPEALEKRLVYPRCVSKTEMAALLPRGEASWETGYASIEEPIPEKSEAIAPEEIDLVLCPCTVFDEGCNRMGMGAGFYDRFLERCPNARIIAVAFEAQKTDTVPSEPWDRPMDAVFTEDAAYRREEK
ncbi:MAG: 5-formyltetrahydrofolate cyclo-ligase [Butyricicoccus sp.]|nr:5-formyltetrahydrofolate cyclo-ligase [Butyricicoccus sp.]